MFARGLAEFLRSQKLTVVLDQVLLQVLLQVEGQAAHVALLGLEHLLDRHVVFLAQMASRGTRPAPRTCSIYTGSAFRLNAPAAPPLLLAPPPTP